VLKEGGRRNDSNVAPGGAKICCLLFHIWGSASEAWNEVLIPLSGDNTFSRLGFEDQFLCALLAFMTP